MVEKKLRGNWKRRCSFLEACVKLGDVRKDISLPWSVSIRFGFASAVQVARGIRFGFASAVQVARGFLDLCCSGLRGVNCSSEDLRYGSELILQPWIEHG
ncbi:hypothetical protein F511_25044 [Dorcoceras hygrometricum]|uniref:Uncharacterized protein n=1 Tax=Dorcoceras hygrometricum TaxID=472368 RepID=A0A2Z7ACC5_9LAMI|nr:hypothetical protein F511_25044 [Dorcoceras hygrometricum]